MPLILAIEPDRRQANQLNAVVKGRLHADLVLADSAEEALAALGDRVPDLILTTALLSPTDEVVLGERLRALNGVAAHVQTLTIPVLAGPRPRLSRARGMLSALRRGKQEQNDAPDGCDPTVFASQCAEYLERAAAERASAVTAAEHHTEIVYETANAQPADASWSTSSTSSSWGEDEVISDFEASIAEVEPIVEPAETTHEPVVNFMTSMLDPIEPRHESMVNSLTAAPEAMEPTPEPTMPIAQADAAFNSVDRDDRSDRGGRQAPWMIDAPAAAATVQHAIAQIEALVAREALAGETVARIEADEHVDVTSDTSDSDIPEGFIDLDLSTLIDEQRTDSPAVREEHDQATPGSSEFADADTPFVYDLNVAADAASTPALGGSPTVFSARPASKRTRKKPTKDEWAFFDPEKCGFAALLAKLDEIIETEEPSAKRRQASRRR